MWRRPALSVAAEGRGKVLLQNRFSPMERIGLPSASNRYALCVDASRTQIFPAASAAASTSDFHAGSESSRW